MSLTTAQLAELQSISETIRTNFPFNGNDQWWAAIRIQNGDLGPTSGSGGQAAFDAAIADMLATQLDIQKRQGILGSQQTGFREATLQVVATTGAAAIPSIAKPSSTGRINDNVISVDPHLVFPNVAPGLYALGGLLLIDGGSNGDFKFRMVVTAGGVFGDFNMTTTQQGEQSTGNTSIVIETDAVDTIVPIITGDRTNLILVASVEVTVQGTLSLSWAQNNLDAVVTTFLVKDSYLTLSELIVAS
jgi:hypothetical protein